MPEILENIENKAPKQELIANLDREMLQIDRDMADGKLDMRKASVDSKIAIRVVFLRKLEIKRIKIYLDLYGDSSKVDKIATELNNSYQQIWQLNDQTGAGLMTERQLKVLQKQKKSARELATITKELQDTQAELERQSEELRSAQHRLKKIKNKVLSFFQAKDGNSDEKEHRFSVNKEKKTQLILRSKEKRKELAKLNTQAQLIELKAKVEEGFSVQDKRLSDTLASKMRKEIRDKVESSNFDAVFESYAASLRLYEELGGRVLEMDKKIATKI